jgi:putative spermidine/putrescine transport system ATP-binding protein
MSMLMLHAVSRQFGATKAVDTVDLTVEEGELVCLLGPSGCGKSTLLRIVAGLVAADSGQLKIDGTDVTRQAANQRPTAMVFQSHALWPHMTVERNIGFGLRVRHIPATEQKRRIAAVLDLVGLSGFEKRYPGEMSGGQAQRVALARCLVVEPSILLMDEPFSALDAHLRRRLRDDFKALQQRLKLTTLFVTHDQDEAMELADRIAVMREGMIDQIAPPGELYLNPQTLHVARFIGEMNDCTMRVSDGVADWHGAKLRIDVPDGIWQALCRPEEIRPAAIGATMQVGRCVDLGSSLRVELADAKGRSIKWLVARDEAPDLGATVNIRPIRLMLYQEGRLAHVVHPIESVPTTLRMRAERGN